MKGEEFEFELDGILQSPTDDSLIASHNFHTSLAVATKSTLFWSRNLPFRNLRFSA